MVLPARWVSARSRPRAACISPNRAISAANSRADSLVPRNRANRAAAPMAATTTGTAQSALTALSFHHCLERGEPAVLLEQLMEDEQVVVRERFAHRALPEFERQPPDLDPDTRGREQVDDPLLGRFAHRH